MDTQGSHLSINKDDGIVRVGFLDRNILEEASIQTIASEVGQLIEEADHPKILISFKNVEHLSSAALGVLITINNKVKEKEGQLRLSSIDPHVYEIFLITKLNILFQIHDTDEQAAESFS